MFTVKSIFSDSPPLSLFSFHLSGSSLSSPALQVFSACPAVLVYKLAARFCCHCFIRSQKQQNVLIEWTQKPLRIHPEQSESLEASWQLAQLAHRQSSGSAGFGVYSWRRVINARPGPLLKPRNGSNGISGGRVNRFVKAAQRPPAWRGETAKTTARLKLAFSLFRLSWG